MRRQVFMVSMGGFDTHANQMRDQPGADGARGAVGRLLPAGAEGAWACSTT
jgi:uncharacterized protein (DUF1501 family)